MDRQTRVITKDVHRTKRMLKLYDETTHDDDDYEDTQVIDIVDRDEVSVSSNFDFIIII